MRININALAGISFCLVFIVSCSSSNNVGKQNGKQDSDSEVPGWYLSTEKNNPEYITSVASATSTQKEFARKNALLTARSKLAKQIRSQVAGVTFSFRREQRVGDELSSESEILNVIKVVTDEKVAETKILEEKVLYHQDENRFEMFVMIGVSKNEFKQAVSNQFKSYSDEEASLKQIEEQLKQQIDAM